MSEISSNRQGLVMAKDLRKLIKIAAAQQGITVSQLVQDAVREYLSNERKTSKWNTDVVD